MLNKQDAQPVGCEGDEQVAKDVSLCIVEARGRLIEQQDRWACSESASEFNQPGVAGGKRTNWLIRERTQIQSLKNQVDLVLGFWIPTICKILRQLGRSTRPASSNLETNLNVLSNSQRREDLESLKGSADAKSGPLMCSYLRDVFSTKTDAARGGSNNTADCVKGGGLACTVWSNQSADATTFDSHGYVAHC
ncbi:unannotated protein [freshwater metagenome]|uniref:Unannotated protein n=1 Tax=freshwater metagenome TaxID=449393 RepID=A0A6J7UPZ1_9ZZZZ